MPLINQICPECGGAGKIAFDSHCLAGRLAWSASHFCDDCKYRVEEDSWDWIPDNYRRLELQHDGSWSIKILDPNNSLINALKVIRQHCKLSLAEIAAIKKQLSEPILTGTRAEMDTIVFHLNKSGVEAITITTNSTCSE